MTNQEAIIEGVFRWLKEDHAVVERCVMDGTEKAIVFIAEAIGAMVSEKVDNFLIENREDIISAMAIQMASKSVIRSMPHQEELTPPV